MNEDLNSKENQTNYENKSFKDSDLKIKNNWKSLIYNVAKGTMGNIGLGLISIVFLKQWFWLFIILLIVLEVIFSIISRTYEYIELKDKEAHYHKGIFSKDTLIIQKKSFKSMDISQNLIERILGYKVVKIENPSKDFGTDDIKMSLTNEQIDILKSFAFENSYKENSLISNEENLNEEEVYSSNDTINNDIDSREIKEKKIKTKKLFLYGFTSFNLVIVSVFIFNIIGNIDDFITSDYLTSMIDGAISNSVIGTSIIFMIIGLLILLIILKIIATIYYVIKYYNFTLYKEGNNIKISYGLFSTKEFSFRDNNIKLVKIKSNPLRQLLNIYELNLVVKGYTGEGNDKIIMYPIGDLNEVKEVIENFIPDWSFEGKGTGIRHGKISIIIKPIILIFIISVIAYLIFKIKWLWLINLFSIFTLINSILKIKNLNISIEDKNVRATNGGLFRTIYILKGKDIQAVAFNTNPIQSKNNIGKITIDYYSEISEEIKLQYMDKQYVEKLVKASKGLA